MSELCCGENRQWFRRHNVTVFAWGQKAAKNELSCTKHYCCSQKLHIYCMRIVVYCSTSQLQKVELSNSNCVSIWTRLKIEPKPTLGECSSCCRLVYLYIRYLYHFAIDTLYGVVLTAYTIKYFWALRALMWEHPVRLAASTPSVLAQLLLLLRYKVYNCEKTENLSHFVRGW